MRKTLSFFKKLETHVGAIWNFIREYNRLTREKMIEHDPNAIFSILYRNGLPASIIPKRPLLHYAHSFIESMPLDCDGFSTISELWSEKLTISVHYSDLRIRCCIELELCNILE